MSRAESNKRLIREYIDAWARGDIAKGESFYSDEFYCYQAGHSRLAGVHHGARGLHKGWVEPVLEMTNGRWSVSGEYEIILSGEDGIVIIVHETMERNGKGKMQTNKLVVYTIRDDKITSCRMFDDDQGAIDNYWS